MCNSSKSFILQFSCRQAMLMQTFNVKLALYYRTLITKSPTSLCSHRTIRHEAHRLARDVQFDRTVTGSERNTRGRARCYKSFYLTVDLIHGSRLSRKSFARWGSKRNVDRLAESLSPSMRFPIPCPFRKHHKLLTIV